MKNIKNPKIAIVTDFLMQLGGAERVILELTKIYPEALIYTVFFDKKKIGSFFPEGKIESLFRNRILNKFYKQLLIFYPFFFRRLNLKKYDIVITVTSALAKGIKKQRGQIHICYCNTPTRFLWIEKYDYIKTAVPKGLQWLMRLVVPWLQRVDFRDSQRVDFFIANSKEVKERIKKYYKRDSVVIYPPVDSKLFSLQNRKQNYYLMTGRIVSYKRFDIAVRAFSDLADKKLIIAGSGPESCNIKAIAGKNIHFLGRVSDSKLTTLYQNAFGYIFTPLEDFGITPLEAMSCGTPVIAYGEGGALETVKDGETGLFFNHQTPKSLKEAIVRFEKIKFDPKKCRAQAEKFSNERFRKKIKEEVEKIINNLLNNQ